MLPAEKPGVNGPRAGSDQRHGYGPHGQYRAIPDMGGRGEGDPHFGAPGYNSGQGRPQTGDEQQAGEASDHLRRPKRVTGRRHRAVQQSTADQQSLDQQPGACGPSANVENSRCTCIPSSAYGRGHGLENIR